MAVVDVGGMLFAAPWQQGEPASLGFWTPAGAWRTIHAIKSAPPDEHYHLCEWRNGRYEAPMEVPPAGCVVSGIYGSGNRGDTGWLVPGTKHGAPLLRLQWVADGAGGFKPIAQFMYTSRWPNAVSGDPYWLAAPINLPFAIASDRDWQSVARTLQTDIAALRHDVQRALGLEPRIDAIERALGSVGETPDLAALLARVSKLESKNADLGAALREAGGAVD